MALSKAPCILYGIANCDTMRKTRKWLDARHVDYRFHDYRKDGCDAALVRQFLRHFAAEALINRRGSTWRQLPESARADLNDERAAELMMAHPALIRRPLLRIDKQWLSGFDEERLAVLFSRQANASS